MQALLNSFTKKCFKFRGRANREEYIYITLLFITFAALIIPYAIFSPDIFYIKCIFLCLGLLLFIHYSTTLIRRLHDINWNGKWIILPHLPLILLCYFVFSISDSLGDLLTAYDNIPSNSIPMENVTTAKTSADGKLKIHTTNFSSNIVTEINGVKQTKYLSSEDSGNLMGSLFMIIFNHVLLLALIGVSSLISNIFILYLLLKKGTSGPNQYGDQPIN